MLVALLAHPANAEEHLHPAVIAAHDVPPTIVDHGMRPEKLSATGAEVPRKGVSPLEVWIRREDHGDGAEDPVAIALAPAGGVYVTGVAGNLGETADCFTLLYDEDGVLVWSDTYDSTGRENTCTTLAVASDGSLAVAGSTDPSPGFQEFLILKYDAAGNRLWTRRYTGSELGGFGNAQIADIAIDSAGAIYATGRAGSPSGSNSGFDYLTMKLDAQGTLEWTARYEGIEHPWGDIPRRIALDGSGYVYVTGTWLWEPSTPGDSDYLTIKYDTAGAQVWERRYSGPGNGDDDANALGVDDDGNVFVAGDSPNAKGDSDLHLIKYDPNGTALWEGRYDGPAGGADAAFDLTISQSGEVSVTGTSWGGDAASETQFDIVTLTYGANGDLRWIDRFDTNEQPSLNESGQSITLDACGSVYVTGGYWGSDLITLKYDEDGYRAWVARYDGPGSNSDWGKSLVVDEYSNVYVTGFSWDQDFDWATIKYAQEGSDLCDGSIFSDGFESGDLSAWQ